MRLIDAAWIAGYASAAGLLAAGAVYAPWPTAAVCTVGAGVALWWVLRIPAVTP